MWEEVVPDIGRPMLKCSPSLYPLCGWNRQLAREEWRCNICNHASVLNHAMAQSAPKSFPYNNNSSSSYHCPLFCCNKQIKTLWVGVMTDDFFSSKLHTRIQGPWLGFATFKVFSSPTLSNDLTRWCLLANNNYMYIVAFSATNPTRCVR